eukprot:CAMPEP_0168734796 /NCGR_PEP_ID=MMETSP0724-20121128/9001_1 /TAXON_ID=265536 /ORGANISM="Amphiprora sp., Strain CCMP467" /LENGTH=167 /DNA_ID=CAMNT_0008781917 /DNA_START=160 /DNA_END=663 /DNA_ORIENTATION=+
MRSSPRHHRPELAYCIVWSPLPPITWIIPVIGHLGIADSNGVASDFRGPYYVGDDGRMAFGAPTRALFLPVEEDAEEWDDAIQQANEVYRGRMHNICCDNCHSHVASALNRMNVKAYGIQGNWDMVKLALLVFVKGRFLSWGAVYAQFGPFAFLVLIVILTKTILVK